MSRWRVVGGVVLALVVLGQGCQKEGEKPEARPAAIPKIGVMPSTALPAANEADEVDDAEPTTAGDAQPAQVEATDEDATDDAQPAVEAQDEAAAAADDEEVDVKAAPAEEKADDDAGTVDGGDDW